MLCRQRPRDVATGSEGAVHSRTASRTALRALDENDRRSEPHWRRQVGSAQGRMPVCNRKELIIERSRKGRRERATETRATRALSQSHPREGDGDEIVR